MTQYIIRLDDACPTMNHQKWSLIESALDNLAIKPIVAVIPDNKDPHLQFQPNNNDFWSLVRKWQDKQWTIAMHGYQHLFHKTNRNLVPLHKKSEFTGLSLDSQKDKMRKAWQIFQKENITPTLWVAPAHGFDATTIKALHQETSIRIISDGFSWQSYNKQAMQWIPQQLWNYHFVPMGTFTICVHPNTWSTSKIEKLIITLKKNRKKISEVSKVKTSKRKQFFCEQTTTYLCVKLYRALAQVKNKLLRRINPTT